MSFNFEIPEKFSEKKTGDMTIYKADKMALFIQQKADMSSYNSINMRVILNDINRKNIFLLNKVNKEIEGDLEYKCISMAKKLVKDIRSNSEYKTGFMKSIMSADHNNTEILIMSLLSVIIPDEKTDCCIVSAVFPCDSEASEKEKLFMNILESVERIDNNE